MRSYSIPLGKAGWRHQLTFLTLIWMPWDRHTCGPKPGTKTSLCCCLNFYSVLFGEKELALPLFILLIVTKITAQFFFLWSNCSFSNLLYDYITRCKEYTFLLKMLYLKKYKIFVFKIFRRKKFGH